MRHPIKSTLVPIAALSVGGAPALAQPEPGRAAFDLGEIVVLGERPQGLSSVGGSVVTQEQSWTFQKLSLDKALELAPGVATTIRGRRNESDVFVRGFNRSQVPLMVDGVRIYLPADNRIDFGRFLTADIAAIQIQKGYASVIDGPGAMGGAINLVTSKPTEPFQAEAGASVAADGSDVRNGYFLAGARRAVFYVQASAAIVDQDSWDMSGDYRPAPNSLEDGGERFGSDSEDWRVNFKLGFTPSDGAEYTLNYIRQQGEKGAPLNVYNNPPVPPASFWRWPYWDVQNTSFLTSTELGDAAYLRTKTYYNTFQNGIDSYDDITYTTQNTGRGFFSPYDDHAYGTSVELGTTRFGSSTFKVAAYYREDQHTEQQINRPTSPTQIFVEPEQEQAQKTWSIAVENTFHVSTVLDVVVGASYDEYRVTKAEEFNANVSPGVFEYPKGGSDAASWQTAVIWRYDDDSQLHASVSERARFPTFFELYSTRFGTATPNPNLGPERATNFEIGWETTTAGGARIGGALFYNDVEDLIQTVVLPDTTTQPQNVGNGRFAGLEVSFDVPFGDRFRLGGNYTHIDLDIEDALQPDLRVDGVPENKAMLYAAWRPVERFTLTPSIELADERWSNVNPPVPSPYIATGDHTLVNFDGSYTFDNGVELAVGARNLRDENYELAWGFPEPGRNLYAKIRVRF